MARTEGEKISQQKYNDANYDRLAILIRKGKRDEYKAAAAAKGLGYAEMIRLAIDEYIKNHAGEVIAPAPVPVGDKLTSEQRKLLDTFADCPDNVKPTLRKLIEQLATNAKNVKDGD